MKLTKIFEPITINKTEFKNRMVEMLPQIVKDGEPAPTYYLKKRMAEHEVKVLTSAAVQEVKEHGVVYKKNDSINLVIRRSFPTM